LFDRARDWEGAADPDIGYALDSAKRSRGAKQNILIVDVPWPFQPEKDDVRNLSAAARGGLDRSQ